MQDDFQSMYKQAAECYNAGQWQGAVFWSERCLSIESDNAEALHLRGIAALALDDPKDAQRWVLKAIERSPNPVFLNSLSVIQTHLGAFARAAESARTALDIATQGHPDIDKSVLLYNLGRALQLDLRFAEAAAVYREVIDLSPRHFQAHSNLGASLKSLGHLDAAVEQLHRALSIQPANPEAQGNLGHALLTLGRYRDAWPHFEHRWSTFQDESGNRNVNPPNLPMPQWKGESTRADRDRLLILHEQGLGDTLHFCRYIPMAMERFSQVGFAGPEPLRRLLSRAFGSTSSKFVYLDATRVDLRQWDMYSPLLSLPMAFDTDADSIPAAIPYLHAEPRAAQRWSKRLAGLHDPARPRIGLAWAGGGLVPEVDARRSMPVETIDALIAWPHALWISVQKPANDEKRLQRRQRVHIVDWMNEMNDFADTAALVASLDLVICVDTSIAHLAGAMGKRVWLLNRYQGCWRWMRDREDTPWYPNMRIFNQKERGDWNEVLARVVVELERGAWRSS
ncbi:hypothetical protein BG58_23465 [Caballeronia jiangsuensis]|nr:hypothetical protein BG58_23465 [Caballeronia jiangsuensis]